MSAAATGAAGLLTTLMGLQPEERASFLRGTDASTVMPELGDEVERMAVSDVATALAAAEMLVSLADQIGTPGIKSRMRRAFAQTLAYAGRLTEALEMCEAAASNADAAGEVIEAARAQLASLHPLASLGRFDDALAAGEQARDIFAASNEPGLAARADLNLGAVHAMRDDPVAALACFDRAYPAFRKQPSILAQLETNRGNALMALDDHQGAESALAAAVAAFEIGGQPLAAAIAEGNRAFLAARQGRLQTALAGYERARRHLEHCDSPTHLARLLAEQAETILTLGLPGDAVDSLDLLIPELGRLGLAVEAARSRVVLARALIAVDRLEDAEQLLVEAGNALLSFGHSIEHARSTLLRANLALKRGDIDGARMFAQEARDELAVRPVDLAMVSTLLARIELADGKLGEAERAIGAAQEIGDRYGLSPLAAELWTLRGRLLRKRGEPALAEFEAAIEETERIRGTLQAARFRSAFHGDRIAPYAELLREALDSDDESATALAFRAAELAKSRALLDLVGGALDPEPSVVAPNELALRAQLDRARADLNWHYSRMGENDAASPPGHAIRDLEREVQRLESRLATTDAAVPSAPPATLDEALAAFDPGTAALSYTFAGDELIAFVLRDGACHVYRDLTTLDQLQSSVRRFRLQISRAQARAQQGLSTDRLAGDARRELEGLWALLVAPLEPRLEGIDRLVIAPHGLLHTVPFGALWDGTSHLVERMEIQTAPSLSLLLRLPGEDHTPSRAGAVIGVPDALTPSIPEEVERVASEIPESRTLLGSDATAERVRSMLEESRTVHLACHGRYSRDHPQASGLKLADRWLTLAEIAALRLPASHVTLSACDTGRSSVLAGDELVGLTSGFFAAGAKSLIVSLWPVNDASAAALMAECYRLRRQGHSFAAALRQAQRSSLEQTPHPAHWAPFMFGGRS